MNNILGYIGIGLSVLVSGYILGRVLVRGINKYMPEKDIKEICHNFDSLETYVENKINSIDDNLMKLEKNMTVLARIMKERIKTL